MANGVVKMQSFVAIPAIVGGGGRRWAPPSRVTNVYVLRNWVALLWIICSTLVSRSASYSPNGHHLTTSSTSTVVPDESGKPLYTFWNWFIAVALQVLQIARQTHSLISGQQKFSSNFLQ